MTANDITGLAALDFLHERKLAVPQDISIVSFDDSYEAFSRELTSYNYGIAAVAKASLEFLIRQNKKGDSSDDQFGFVASRNSIRAVGPNPQEMFVPFRTAGGPTFNAGAPQTVN